jgi:hypothetical protein
MTPHPPFPLRGIAVQVLPVFPWGFTEHGAVMAATVLNSPPAVAVSLYVVHTLIRFREPDQDELGALHSKSVSPAASAPSSRNGGGVRKSAADLKLDGRTYDEFPRHYSRAAIDADDYTLLAKAWAVQSRSPIAPKANIMEPQKSRELHFESAAQMLDFFHLPKDGHGSMPPLSHGLPRRPASQ